MKSARAQTRAVSVATRRKYIAGHLYSNYHICTVRGNTEMAITRVVHHSGHLKTTAYYYTKIDKQVRIIIVASIKNIIESLLITLRFQGIALIHHHREHS